MTTPRESLAQVIATANEGACTCCVTSPGPAVVMPLDVKVAEAVIEFLKPRVITTAEELDALPVKTIIRDCVGDAWRKHPDRWRCSYNDDAIQVWFAPFEVVFTPAAT